MYDKAAVTVFKREDNYRVPIEIRLSRPYFMRYPQDFLEVMLHEMIHVRFPMEIGHGKRFKEEVKTIGKKYDIIIREEINNED